MRKIVRKIGILLFCLLLAIPMESLAAGKVIYEIKDDQVHFGIKTNFEILAEAYKVVLFTRVQEEEEVWVSVYSTHIDQETMKNQHHGAGVSYSYAYPLPDVPKVDASAVMLYESTEEGWKESDSLEEDRRGFSEIEYQVFLINIDSDFIPEEISRYYIKCHIGEEWILFPLSLAEELYGFTHEPKIPEIDEMRICLKVPEGVFEEYEPEIYVASENRETKLILRPSTIKVEIMEEAQTEAANTEAITETEIEIETESEATVDDIQILDGETVSDGNIQSITELVTEEAIEEVTEPITEEATEPITEEVTEPITEEATEPITEEVTEPITEEVAEEATEPVTESATEGKTDPAAATNVDSDAGSSIGIILLGIFLILVAVLMLLIFRAKGEENKNRKAGVPKEADTLRNDTRNADTLNPDKKTEKIVIAPKKTQIHGVVVNNKGRVRKNNEDNFYLNGTIMQRDKMDDGIFISNKNNDIVQLYAVCDGMGGADCGEDASYGAVKELELRKAEHHNMFNPKRMISVLRDISDKIYQDAEQKGRKSGTTIVMMLVAGGKVIFSNVGDSRIYRFRGEKLKQISLDHSKVQRMISMGLLTPEQAKRDPSRHVITQYMGMPSEIMISPYIVTEEELLKEDVYILCSDGLPDMVEDDQMEGILKEYTKPQEAAQALVNAALYNGGRDNVTVMVLRVLKD